MRLDDVGLVAEFLVMVRPLSGPTALVEQMAARMERALGEAGLS